MSGHIWKQNQWPINKLISSNNKSTEFPTKILSVRPVSKYHPLPKDKINRIQLPHTSHYLLRSADWTTRAGLGGKNSIFN